MIIINIQELSERLIKTGKPYSAQNLKNVLEALVGHRIPRDIVYRSVSGIGDSVKHYSRKRAYELCTENPYRGMVVYQRRFHNNVLVVDDDDSYLETACEYFENETSDLEPRPTIDGFHWTEDMRALEAQMEVIPYDIIITDTMGSSGPFGFNVANKAMKLNSLPYVIVASSIKPVELMAIARYHRSNPDAFMWRGGRSPLSSRDIGYLIRGFYEGKLDELLTQEPYRETVRTSF